MSISLEALVGISPRRFVALVGPVLGKLPPVEEIPRPRLPRWKATRLMLPATIAMARRISASQRRMPEFLAEAPSRCDRLRAEIEQTTDAATLARLWQDKVRPLIVEAADMLAAAGTHGTMLLSGPGKLATLVGEADAALLLSGQPARGTPLASLGPVIGLTRLARGEIDRGTYTRQYGHRSAHEAELSIPRPAEDPALDRRPARRPPGHHPRRQDDAGEPGGGTRRRLEAAGPARPQEGSRGAHYHHALGADRP